MPIYEYFCSKCKSKFELLRSMKCLNDDAFCPTCNAKGQKILSTFNSSSKGTDGGSIPMGGFNNCSGCSQASCSSCN
ncbi:MAG: zinc ribbon domain-containing protein [Dehalococcoidales bacterium]|nr:zinc ribbon domain-containing protein [Dehalococcoidales bacterium]